MSLARRILDSKRPLVLFHTHSVSRELLARAISEAKSMDLDVCVDVEGNPYLGHSAEYYEKSGEARLESVPLDEAVDALARSAIPVIVDCKRPEAWPAVKEVVARIGAKRCLVHCFVSEFKFDYSRKEGEPDFTSEWSPIEALSSLKDSFPDTTTTASAKWLPRELLLSEKYSELLLTIRRTLKANRVDTVCLNVPGETWSDRWLALFLEEGIIPHISIDGVDLSALSELYIGETDDLGKASVSSYLQLLSPSAGR
jgi:hypothetical protein